MKLLKVISLGRFRGIYEEMNTFELCKFENDEI